MCLEASVPDHLAHDVPVLLLHVAGIILFVRAATSERDVFPLAVAHQVSVDELSAVVESMPRMGTGMRLDFIHGSDAEPFATAHERRGDGPAGSDIGHVERVDVFASRAIGMSDQIYFQEPGLILSPIGESADRDLVFEKGSGLGGRAPLGIQIPSSPALGAYRWWRR